MITLQASCVAIGGRALLIEGPPGAGKTSLALALIDRGARLIGDDGVGLTKRAGQVWAVPPPNITGLIEVRNVGIISLPATSAPLSLILTLNPDAPRFADQAGTKHLAGAEFPQVEFFAADPVAAIRAEYALARYGLE